MGPPEIPKPRIIRFASRRAVPPAAKAPAPAADVSPEPPAAMPPAGPPLAGPLAELPVAQPPAALRVPPAMPSPPARAPTPGLAPKIWPSAPRLGPVPAGSSAPVPERLKRPLPGLPVPPAEPPLAAPEPAARPAPAESAPNGEEPRPAIAAAPPRAEPVVQEPPAPPAPDKPEAVTLRLPRHGAATEPPAERFGATLPARSPTLRRASVASPPLPKARPEASAPMPRGDAPPTGTPRPLRLGLAALLAILLCLILLGGWAALAPRGDAVVARGRLVAEYGPQEVRHPDGGLVARLLVGEGARVAAGDVLMVLDPARAQAQAALARSQWDAARLALARQRAEQSSPAEWQPPEALLERARREPPLAALIQAQRSLMETRRVAFEGEVAVLNQRILQLRDQIGGLAAQDRARAQQARAFRQELEGVVELLRGGHATRTRALALERDIARLEGERGEHAIQVARLEQAIGEAELQILQRHRALDEELAAGLRDAQQAVAQAQEQLAAAEERARRLEIRAPLPGVVQGLAVQAQGALVVPGQLLLRIIPTENPLRVEAEIGLEELARLRPGAAAVIEVADLPRLTGHLLEFSATPPADAPDGPPPLRASLAVDGESRARLAERGIGPGLPVRVTIRGEDQTLLGDLFARLMQALGR